MSSDEDDYMSDKFLTGKYVDPYLYNNIPKTW